MLCGGLAAALGLGLVFLHPLAVGSWIVTCGVGAIFSAFFEGFSIGLRHLVVMVLAFVAPFVTLLVALEGWVAPAWIVLAAVAAVGVRARFGLDATELEEDFVI